MPLSPSSTSVEQPLKEPLKPILKHPHKPITNKNPLKPTLTPAPPPKTRQGDPLWLRIMHTKEHQWRLINTIALHELNLLERSACTQLDALAEQLDALITQTTKLDTLVSNCRAIRAQQNFLRLASQPLRTLVRLLLRLPYPQLSDALLDSNSALLLHAPGLDNELSRFRAAARRFAHAAEQNGLHDLVGVAALLQHVADIAVKEPDAVTCAAQAVVDAATNSEKRRLDVVDNVVQLGSNTFVADPSFIE